VTTTVARATTAVTAALRLKDIGKEYVVAHRASTVPQSGVTSVTHDPQAAWSRRKRGVYAAFGGVITLTVVGLIAHIAHEAFLFPSLGPTAFIVFFAAASRQAAPRNVVCGQLIGVAAGIVAVVGLGLREEPVNLDDITIRRLLAALLAVAITFIVMTWLGVEHAPAAATTLIVALGVVRSASGFAAVVAAIVVTTVLAFVINRAFRLPYPVWNPREATESSL
jgi:CBS domain-containing membrane protein